MVERTEIVCKITPLPEPVIKMLLICDSVTQIAIVLEGTIVRGKETNPDDSACITFNLVAIPAQPELTI